MCLFVLLSPRPFLPMSRNNRSENAKAAAICGAGAPLPTALSGQGPSHCLVLMLPRPPHRQPPELEFLVT